ncbi:MAG: DUF2971 domain-containing protein [Sphingorhabdus sp.]|uniref:DUF2971 domain-containing protein n=1 Tax=Sphingorhabdus sp. TaxID=1902408 RepID=UPI0025F46058|nr:DUF2971 domain-containing protein [Sphingorhabdus sp.]MCO4090749.1 DUF2971 domain-containing protein [Sphingorhabdus sp.]
MENPQTLRRYTNLPVLIDMLVSRKLTTIGYSHWVDANDREGLSLYQRALGYGFVGAVCLTRAPETFHHWQIYASGPAGVSVILNKQRLDELCKENEHFYAGDVRYILLNRIDQIEAKDIHQLPFFKRYGFGDEKEYRVVSFSVEKQNSMGLEFDTRLIERVVVSPFAHPSLITNIRKVLRSIEPWQNLTVEHSTLTDSETWKAALANYEKRHGVIYGKWVSGPIDIPIANYQRD